MRSLIIALCAASVAVPVTFVAPTDQAEARRDRREYREWRGRDGRTYCRKPDGTTGLVVGAVGGALIGRTIDTRGDRTLGTLGGAVLGGLAGREIERSRTPRRCR